MDKANTARDFSSPKNVIIVGGSLSALMHGLVLHHHGFSVRILEKALTETPPSHMAGVCLGADVLRLLERFDRISEIPLGIRSVQLQSLGLDGKAHPFLKAQRIMSSWDALYLRLRANFDLLASEYVPHPPGIVPLAGEDIETAESRAKYEYGREVIDVKQLETGQLLVFSKDLNDGGKKIHSVADLVLGADGPNSVVRNIFLGPGQVSRKYSGYVAWRGVVPEEQVSRETQEVFRANITYSILKGEGGHVILYNIPGEKGSVEPGKRMLNFCWYTNIPASSLDTIMTDVDGTRHKTQLPTGKIRPSVWEEQMALARTLFAPPYLEVIDKISSPFLHLITDYYSPRASLAGGKVLLVGDASALLRPHIAFSTNQAAYQALLTEKLIKGELSNEQWGNQVSMATYLHWRRSVWFGEYFQQPIYVSLQSAVRYWMASTMATLQGLIGWLPEQTV